MSADNAADTTETGQRKQIHSDTGIRSPFLIGSSKEQWDTDTEKEKGEKCYQTHKSRMVNTKTSTRKVSVAVEVLLHSRRQKSLLLLLKNMILKKEAQALQVFIFFFFIIAIFFLGVFRD